MNFHRWLDWCLKFKVSMIQKICFGHGSRINMLIVTWISNTCLRWCLKRWSYDILYQKRSVHCDINTFFAISNTAAVEEKGRLWRYFKFMLLISRTVTVCCTYCAYFSQSLWNIEHFSSFSITWKLYQRTQNLMQNAFGYSWVERQWMASM